MSNGAPELVRKLWGYCNVLRDDGLSYPDYVEQLTYLLFLKMAEEQGNELVPPKLGWRSFAGREPAAMQRRYSNTLRSLGREGGTLGLIFRDARNKISDPAKLRLLVDDLIGETEWIGLSADVKGDAYEGLLEKNARDTKSGAGQYFTPRPLIEAIVRCVDPRRGEVICDPACGTGGFLLAAFDHVSAQSPLPSPREARHLRRDAIRGVELVQEVARLAGMNLFLHGIAANPTETPPITCEDSLRVSPKRRVEVVLTNPPFGTKGSVTYSTASERKAVDDLTIVREDFWVNSSNKQLNFLQHVVSLLKKDGRAAVIVPDNVLFESGAAAAVRRRLLETCDVHTLLRLPTGLFYAQGVKANVLFFDRRTPDAKSSVWVYDLRSDRRFSLKSNPLRGADLQEFVSLYRPGDRLQRRMHRDAPRWRQFSRQDLLASAEARLDASWSLDPAVIRQPGLTRLDEIAEEIAVDLRLALEYVDKVRRSDGT